jgi:hypothetical protein
LEAFWSIYLLLCFETWGPSWLSSETRTILRGNNYWILNTNHMFWKRWVISMRHFKMLHNVVWMKFGDILEKKSSNFYQTAPSNTLRCSTTHVQQVESDCNIFVMKYAYNFSSILIILIQVTESIVIEIWLCGKIVYPEYEFVKLTLLYAFLSMYIYCFFVFYTI